jgi:hypothetical protein
MDEVKHRQGVVGVLTTQSVLPESEYLTPNGNLICPLLWWRVKSGNEMHFYIANTL